VNSQTGIIMQLLGAAKKIAEDENKQKKQDGKFCQDNLMNMPF
jgi:hypothetical protein